MILQFFLFVFSSFGMWVSIHDILVEYWGLGDIWRSGADLF